MCADIILDSDKLGQRREPAKMGRRKIEIKAIKDDRNRSVYVAALCACLQFLRLSANTAHLYSTFLKRKGGLFKKAHELSVLCSVDVAVFIFGSNKKLYEYSSSSMTDLMNRYHYVRISRP